MRSLLQTLVAILLVAAVTIAAVVLFVSGRPLPQHRRSRTGVQAQEKTAGREPMAVSGSNWTASLADLKPYVAKRISSYDTTGGNDDRLHIPPGATVTLAEIKGAGAITHIWCTIAAEPFYGKKIVLRMYWDGNDKPCVESPLGDFFGVGHGLDRKWWSLPFTVTSEGRARNSFIPMPFNQSARIEVTNEGEKEIGAFYYYVDYRLYDQPPPTPMPLFHARYNQKMPNRAGTPNYLILDAEGRGHYIGCTLSDLNRATGWWGEGDDMIYVDGEARPSLHGTGTEDYFCDAWGFRHANGPYYGVIFQEEGYDIGDKASVYRFHLADPIPFRRSLRVTLEHGHVNDRGDDWSSVAYWYQLDPHKEYGEMPPVEQRLPFAVILPQDFRSPGELLGSSRQARVLVDSLPYYRPDGEKLAAIHLAPKQSQVDLHLPVEVSDKYTMAAMVLRGPEQGKGRFVLNGREIDVVNGASDKMELVGPIALGGETTLSPGASVLSVRSVGGSFELAGLVIAPVRDFIRDWYVIGPFDNPKGAVDTEGLGIVYPPEQQIDLNASYSGKDGKTVRWQRLDAPETGYVDLAKALSPNEYTVAYALTYVRSPDERRVPLLLGSDDGIRVWLNDQLVHDNLVKRGSRPDNDRVDIVLRSGWNRLLIKVEQGVGGWGFHARIPDPDSSLRFSAESQ